MSSFPAPYPMPNAAGAAADAAGSASSVYNSLQNRLAAAAAQQQTLQRQQAAQDHQDQQDYFRAIQDGWVPAQNEVRRPDGFIDRNQPSRPNMDPSRTAMIGRKQMYKPTDAETGKTFVPSGQLAEALKTAGWDGTTPISPEQSHGIMQALNEAQPKDEPYQYDASGKFRDAATGKPVPGFIGHKTKQFYPIKMGPPEGQQQQNAGSGPQDGQGQPQAAGYTFELPDKANGADKPDAQSILPGQQGPNGGLLVFNKNKQAVEEIPVPKGSKAVMTAAQMEGDKDRHQKDVQDATRRADDRSTRAEDKAQKERDDAQKRIDTFNVKEQEQHEKRAAYGSILRQPNTKSKESGSKPVMVIDPESKQQVELTPARRQFYQDRYNKATDLAGTYGEQSKKLITRFGGDTGATTASPTAKASPQTGQAKPTAAAAPKEGMIIVNPKTKERRVLKGGAWQSLP